jgi:hypothetical protein
VAGYRSISGPRQVACFIVQFCSRKSSRPQERATIGAIAPDMPITYATLYLQPDAGQKAFLVAQRNPVRKEFRLVLNKAGISSVRCESDG